MPLRVWGEDWGRNKFSRAIRVRIKKTLELPAAFTRKYVQYYQLLHSQKGSYPNLLDRLATDLPSIDDVSELIVGVPRHLGVHVLDERPAHRRFVNVMEVTLSHGGVACNVATDASRWNNGVRHVVVVQDFVAVLEEKVCGHKSPKITGLNCKFANAAAGHSSKLTPTISRAVYNENH